MNYFWQEERGKQFYRFQTDDKIIADRMKRREKFKLAGRGYNCCLWIYQAIFTRPDIAKKAFKTLTGSKPILNKADDVFEAVSNMTRLENSAALNERNGSKATLCCGVF